MFNYLRKAGTADVSVVIRIIDSSDGTPETGVVYNTSGIDLEYRREGATSTDITEATLAGLDSAHSDGGFLHIGNGYYRLDLPDAACAAGATGVLVHGTVTGMVVIGCYIQLVTFDPFDTVRLGLTALPNAAADAAGGLPISDAGGLDLDTRLNRLQADYTATEKAAIDLLDDANGLVNIHDTVDTVAGYLDTEVAAILADTNELQTDWVNGGRLDLLIDAIKAKTDSLTFTVAGDVDCNVQSWGGAAAPAMTGDAYARLGAPAGASIAADIAAIEAQTDDIGAAGAGLTGVPWNAAWDAEVQSECTDALNAYDPPTKAELDTAQGAVTVAALGANVITAASMNADAGTEIAAAVAAKAGAVTSLSLELLIERIYEMVNDKMTVNETTGAVALRNIGDSGTVATGNVASSSGTTTRAELSWA